MNNKEMKIAIIIAVLLSVAAIAPLLSSQDQFVLGDHGFEHDTCFTISVSDCKTVTEKAKTTDVFLQRCIVTLADGNEITVYKGKDSCYALKQKYSPMTYEEYQEVTMTEFNNRINEAGENVGKMFIPDFLAVFASEESSFLQE